MKTQSFRPLAVRLGLVHVSVAKSIGRGWAAMVWLPSRTEPYPIGSGHTFEQAIDQARGFAATDPMFMLELPVDHEPAPWSELIHVDHTPDGSFNVSRESVRGAEALHLAYFASDRREQALAFAFGCTIKYEARLGRIA